MKKMAQGLKEYSVIYTDRATNLMSSKFQTCMKDIMTDLCEVYHTKKCAIIPGSGTMAMEAVARQFGNNQPCLVVRNGFFSYRWSQILEQGNITDKLTVIKGSVHPESRVVTPPNVEEVCERILKEKPRLVCMPHVETSVGVIVSNDYISKVAEATHQGGGLFCLDGIASGTVWVNMEALGVDVYITAPQKGWSSPASCGISMMSQKALDMLETTQSSSFSLDLKKWISVSDSYTNGGFMYHTTTPTDALMEFRDNIKETKEFGYEKAEKAAWELGNGFRAMLEENGFKSVAADGWKSPTVIVSHCKENMVPFFKDKGIQVAGMVPFMIDEPQGIMTFRVGVFGLDKLANIQKTIDEFRATLTD